MAFKWFRPRHEPTSGAAPASDASPTVLLHARIRANLGTPGPHLCKPQHGCQPLAGLARRRIAAFVFGETVPHTSELELAPAGADESYLLMTDQRGVESDVVAFGLLPKSVCQDPWRLWIVLQRLFDANDRLSTPVLPAVPQFVAGGELVRPDHLRQLCWSALRMLPPVSTAVGAARPADTGRVLSETDFEQLWSQLTGAEAQALHGARIERSPG